MPDPIELWKAAEQTQNIQMLGVWVQERRC